MANENHDELGRFTFGDMASAIQDAAGENIGSITKDFAFDIEQGNNISFDKLRELYNKNPKLAGAVSWVQQNVLASWNNNKFPDSYTKGVFDKMSTVKDYTIYRTDNRFNKDSNIKIGDTIDLSDRMYHATSEKATTDIYNRGNAYTLSIKRGHALKLGYGKASNLPGDNEIHMISNKYKVSKIEDGYLHLEEL